MRLKNLGLLAVLSAGLGLGASGAGASMVPLSDLINGTNGSNGTIQQGDKLFSNFSYASTGDMPSANGINVTGITSTLGNYGIEFQGAFEDNAGGGASDALIKYTVTVMDPNRVITDAHLDTNLIVIGTPDPSNHSSITETFTAVQPSSPPLTAFLTNFNFNNIAAATKLSDDATWGLPGYTVINVQKDILLNAGTLDPSNGYIGAVGLSFVDQTFSQQAVPEIGSGTTALAALAGFAGLGLLRRRRLA